MADRDDIARLLHRRLGSLRACTWLMADGYTRPNDVRLSASDLATELADAVLAAGWVRGGHGVAWQDKANIICECGQVFSHDYGKSPAPLLGTTSDYYFREHCGDRYARHLRDLRAALDGGTGEEAGDRG